MKTYRDEAIVLRTHKLGEADRIITLLTSRNGQVRAVAKGIRKTTSRFGARLEPFSLVSLQLHRGRSLDIVTQVETISAYGKAIAADYALFTCGTAMLEAASRLTDDSPEAAGPQFLLLNGALSALALRRHPAQLVLDSYLLRAIALAGWAPSFYDCAICGAAGPHRSFHAEGGGVVCDTCRPPGSLTPPPAALSLIGSLLSGRWSEADASAQETRDDTSRLVTGYIQYHLDRQLRSLKMVER